MRIELFRTWWRQKAVIEDNGWARTDFGFIGMSISPASAWIGAHWSSYNKRLCVNLLPFVTIWITLPGGSTP